MKKLVSILLSLIFFVSITTPSYAAEREPVSDNITLVRETYTDRTYDEYVSYYADKKGITLTEAYEIVNEKIGITPRGTDIFYRTVERFFSYPVGGKAGDYFMMEVIVDLQIVGYNGNANYAYINKLLDKATCWAGTAAFNSYWQETTLWDDTPSGTYPSDSVTIGFTGYFYTQENIAAGTLVTVGGTYWTRLPLMSETFVLTAKSV